MSKILQFFPVSSSFVEWVGFYSGTLYVRLRGSSTYRYSGATIEDYRAIESAGSAGSAYNDFRAKLEADTGLGGKKINSSDPELRIFRLLDQSSNPELEQSLRSAWAEAALESNYTGFF